MKIAIFREEGIVGINGYFKQVDTSTLALQIKCIQWNGSSGYVEYNDGTPNRDITRLAAFQEYVDMWHMPPQLPIVPAEEMIAAAHRRIVEAYDAAIHTMTAGYPEEEMKSWIKQEEEAKAWLLDNNAATPWIDAAYAAREIPKAELVAKIMTNAELFAPLHGALTGKRQKLRDQIDALGLEATRAQLDLIQW